MFISIRHESSEPIYLQLIHQLKKAIVKKQIKEGEILPSIRVLAGDLGVNMHTVNKSYNLLVTEGILVKSQKGYMLNPENKLPQDFDLVMKKKIEELMIDVYIHDMPVELVQVWTQDIAKKLKRKW